MGATERWRIRVTGTVQGVGFRPFIHRLAGELDLRGWVRNDSQGVLIDVEGPAGALDELAARLTTEPPRLARIASVTLQRELAVTGAGDFHIAATTSDEAPTSPVGIDTATCDACLAEVDDPTNRRFRYPFTNCTDCGPRYTIVRSVPYDRPATTMAGFTMCPACQAEYDDPVDRRFHAQPNACPSCGPHLAWRSPDGKPQARGDDALIAAATALRSGQIVAIKGIGGYHLSVDATGVDAVAELRRRKHRDDKPFAVMVPDLAAARVLSHLTTDAVAALVGPGRPVVLAPVRADGPLAPGVAPGLAEVGLLLPYTPLHHLLLGLVRRPLVMTSGNLSDEPIAHTDDDAVVRLGPLVDGLLTHDRPIHIRCDDSVVRATRHRTQVLRRSRGYAPEPLALPVPTTRPILALGAELKSTVAVAWDGWVVASHHIGDLEHLATYQAFLQAIDHLCHLYDVRPEAVVHDLHPEYLSTKLAHDLDLPLVGVQHHHAHVASCLTEHGRSGPVVGLAFDGLGYGSDATLWGGEVLVASLEGSQRVGHLRPIAQPGGAAATREPWRMAAAWTAAAGCAERSSNPGVGDDLQRGVAALVAARHGPTTTSMGRLFDALGSLVTGRTVVTYEAQAAIELEALARSVARTDAPRWDDMVPIDRTGRLPQLDPRPLVTRVLDELARSTAPEVVAAAVHEALGAASADLAAACAEDHGLDTVALTGGVFQNARLTDVVEDTLHQRGMHVLLHHHVPANDGGISIGQAAVAATRAF